MSLTPASDSMTIIRGATYTDTITCLDGDGAVVDLTGCTAIQQARPLAGEPVVFEMSTANGRITLGGALGTIVRTLTDEYTDTLPAGDYKTDLFLTWPDGRTDCLIAGYASIKAPITEGA